MKRKQKQLKQLRNVLGLVHGHCHNYSHLSTQMTLKCIKILFHFSRPPTWFNLSVVSVLFQLYSQLKQQWTVV